jgi:AcrR family transcriptional regulator
VGAGEGLLGGVLCAVSTPGEGADESRVVLPVEGVEADPQGMGFHQPPLVSHDGTTHERSKPSFALLPANLIVIMINNVTGSEQRTKTGRPSMAVERRRSILDAFIELIGERGLEAVTLDDVAGRAGVQRSVVRHYVGNREALVLEAAARLVDRYELVVREAVGSAPAIRRLIDHMFGRSWAASMDIEDRAFDELFAETVRHPELKDRLRRAYELLIDELAMAIRREQPTRSATDARQTAYQVVCLAEYNAVLQSLGLPEGQARAARRTALSLAGRSS